MTSLIGRFSEFLEKSWLKAPYVYVLVGSIAFLVGAYLSYNTLSFESRATSMQVSVIAMNTKRGDRGMLYQPVFEAVGAYGETLRHSGDSWVSPKPHEEGDIVDGLVDWPNQEIRSVAMLESSKTLGTQSVWVGGFFFLLGCFLFWRRRTPAGSAS